jgi:hypothetical protein
MYFKSCVEQTGKRKRQLKNNTQLNIINENSEKDLIQNGIEEL